MKNELHEKIRTALPQYDLAIVEDGDELTLLLTGFDDYDGTTANEYYERFHEEYLEALRAIDRNVRKLTDKDLIYMFSPGMRKTYPNVITDIEAFLMVKNPKW